MRLIKIAFAAVALLTFASCESKQEIKEATIGVTPDYIELTLLGGEAEVTVSSSEDWTLVGDYTWITPSSVQGKNGSTVTFNAEVNTTGKPRSASFTFKVADKEAELIVKQQGQEIEMTLGLTAVSAGDTDVTLSMTVDSDDIDLFSKWGVIYSTTDNMEEGEELEIEGTPAVGTKEVVVEGLETNVTYYFWGYAEDITGTRFYTEEPVEETTGTPAPDPDPTPTPPSEDGTPAHFAEMKNNSIAITWANESAVNNLSGITMETLFRWDAFNSAEGIDTMFGVEGGWLVRCMNNFHWIPEDGWYICTPAGNLCFAAFERNTSAANKPVTNWKGMTQGTWHHLAITYDSASGAMAVYIDGSATLTGTNNIGAVNLLYTSWTGEGANNTFHIGKSYNESRWFNGALSEVRIWSRALSADEINAEGHFYGVNPSTAQGLVAYWKLDGTGTHVEDYSGNGNHGTAQNAL